METDEIYDSEKPHPDWADVVCELRERGYEVKIGFDFMTIIAQNGMIGVEFPDSVWLKNSGDEPLNRQVFFENRSDKAIEYMRALLDFVSTTYPGDKEAKRKKCIDLFHEGNSF